MNSITLKYAALAVVVIGTFVTALGASPAYAERNAAEAVSISVAIGDLDLNSAAGAKTLYQRLRGAARSACDERGQRISEIVAYRACYDQALQTAVNQFNSVRLTALHAESAERSS